MPSLAMGLIAGRSEQTGGILSVGSRVGQSPITLTVSLDTHPIVNPAA